MFAVTPISSPLRRLQYSLPVNQTRTLRYRNLGDRPFYSVLDASKLADEDQWGDLHPEFYQVGPDDCGSPFLVNKALLVTGANADTNAMLYATMVRRQDWAAFVSNYEPTLSPDSVGAPSEWVNVPLVYVNRADVN
jgi:hypothetical protein